ncbi:myb dna-binding domain protein [Paraphaeosphaeria minitans]|uniref:Myb dna-binding domain protein n=1 Tax=Paraphaeosphaeria minitans TaxID=565426 RepID=A0A9P6G3X1_9PLEO|nr:myb dna-binding domain protein [Paraphaeosphaeria minitans]
MTWDDVAKHLHGRSSLSCRLRYQNHLEKRAVLDEENFAYVYDRYTSFKEQMWQIVGTALGIPWRTAEALHWQLGQEDMTARTNSPLFKLHPLITSGSIDMEGRLVNVMTLP